MTRHIIFHHHLFKNAGTSIDQILKQNFADRWVSAEFESDGAANTAEVAAWIKGNPDAAAFSTHTLKGPLPLLDGVHIIPVVMLRDPVDRIGSAYRFERIQNAETFGTGLARQNGFAGYVHARLAVRGDRQCRNFQTQRLAALCTQAQREEVERARQTCDQIIHQGVLGIVPEFTQAMERLSQLAKPHYPNFRWQPVTANASSESSSSVISPDMRQMLEEINAEDIVLYKYARKLKNRPTSRAVVAHDSELAPSQRLQYRGAV
ncbi:sulfotransferase family 2 domain-containing protein [Sulfitobacter noctilucae]|uniref:sulfotransferase family 2 domain-containing protein n=1 Tax=Sulfitobacter noctilucae TaxID=1342302 RepID=UPI00046ADEF3|nr:sulfotransferase family 2 domain-containing protein [Sulfitobacter noctilucae]